LARDEMVGKDTWDWGKERGEARREGRGKRQTP